MPPVHIMIKPVSGLCNMRCSYCFYADEMEHRSDNMCKKMSETTMENVIRKSLEFADGSCTFAFQGGEPTLADWTFTKTLEIEEKYNTKKVKIEHALRRMAMPWMMNGAISLRKTISWWDYPWMVSKQHMMLFEKTQAGMTPIIMCWKRQSV